MKHGFTLVEMIVAVGLFTAVMLVATTSLLTILDANRKSQSLSAVMNNLNFALEGMSRNIRVGSTYHCGSSGALTVPQNCSAGDSFLAFEPFGGSAGNPNDQVVYRLNGTQLEESVDGGATFIGLTAPEVVLTNVKFFTDGALKNDNIQARVLILVEGYAGKTDRTKTSFTIQTLATQRLYDL